MAMTLLSNALKAILTPDQVTALTTELGGNQIPEQIQEDAKAVEDAAEKLKTDVEGTMPAPSVDQPAQSEPTLPATEPKTETAV